MKTKNKTITCFGFAIAIFALPTAAIDIPLADDVGVFQGSPSGTYNYGKRVDFLVSSVSGAARWAYLRFNLAGHLPPGTRSDDVEKAVLRLWPSTVTTPGRIAFHRVFSSNAWSEGTKNGAVPGAENSITFNTRIDPTATEVVGSPSWEGMVDITAENADNFLSIDVTGLVQLWLNDPASNKGIILKPQTDISALFPTLLPINVVFDSKENAATAKQPALEITLIKKRIRPLGDLSMGTFKSGPTPDGLAP